MVQAAKWGAIVLAGGRSVRMGQPKAWISVQGEPLLGRVARIISQVCHEVVVVGRPGVLMPPLPASIHTLLEPAHQDEQGPLAGIVVGLGYLQAHGVEVAYLSGCDAALLTEEHVRFVLQRLHTGCDIDGVLPVSAGPDKQSHPLAAAVRVGAALGAAKRLLAGGERRLVRLFAELRVDGVDSEQLPDPRVLLPCNKPEHWHRLLQCLEHKP